MRQGRVGQCKVFALFVPCFVLLIRTILNAPSVEKCAQDDCLACQQALEQMRSANGGAGDGKAVQRGNGGTSTGNDIDNNECSVYLAPSSVADSNKRPAGFGVYTTKPLMRGDHIFPRGTGPTVAITDLISNNNGTTPSWAQPIFMPHCSNFDIEGAAAECLKSNGNVGSVTNFHPMLINTKPRDTDIYIDDMLDRKTDPGIGAFSYHRGENWYATRDVAAGEEIYNDYWERWFFDNQLEKEGGKNIPHRRDYFEAADSILSFVNGNASCAKKEKSLSQKCLDSFTKEMANTLGKRANHLITLATADVKTFLGLIEATKESVKAQKERRAAPTHTFLYDDYPTGGEEVMQLAMQIGRLTILPGHDVDWIKENGRCLDNIYPSKSSIPQAGQGAFAARSMKAGESIVPIPTMVQVTYRETLGVCQNGASADRSGKIPISQQLLTNYCFGDDESSLLLCPASNANLINHCSTRLETAKGSCDPKQGPNAILRWGTDFDPETSEWLEQTIEEIDERVQIGRRGLSLEVVATRDIGQDEEVFIDYGASWEKAWEKHVISWVPPNADGGKAFVPIAEMNMDTEKYILTADELQNGDAYPYPDVQVGCFVQGFYHQCEILERDSASISDLSLSEYEIKRRRSLYKVRIRKWGSKSHSFDVGYKWPFSEKLVEVKVSGSEIRFFAGPYGSDQFLPQAFRHHIGVPKGMWPRQWLNRKR